MESEIRIYLSIRGFLYLPFMGEIFDWGDKIVFDKVFALTEATIDCVLLACVSEKYRIQMKGSCTGVTAFQLISFLSQTLSRIFNFSAVIFYPISLGSQQLARPLSCCCSLPKQEPESFPLSSLLRQFPSTFFLLHNKIIVWSNWASSLHNFFPSIAALAGMNIFIKSCTRLRYLTFCDTAQSSNFWTLRWNVNSLNR